MCPAARVITDMRQFFQELPFFQKAAVRRRDTGVIDGIRVYDVQEKGEQIFHYLEGELEEGKTVTGQIDWDKRFSRMQRRQRRTYRIGNRSCTFWI